MDQSNICFLCNKKLTLVEIYMNKCKCDHTFCKKHKESDIHNCNFSYFIENSNVLQRTLAPIISQKVIKI
jgi:hypothetical protein